MRVSILWLLTLTALIASLIVNVISAFSSITPPESRFYPVDGMFNHAEYIDLGRNDTLFVRYSKSSDSGIEVERRTGGRTQWIAYTPGLGVRHSEYYHSVSAHVGWPQEGQVAINSTGSSGRFEQVIDLSTGKLLERTDYAREYP